jgi:hypothetical protein
LPIENPAAVFVFSCIIALYAFGVERLSVSEPDSSPGRRIFQVLLLICNSVLNVKSDVTVMVQSLWFAMMQEPFQIQQASDYILPDKIREMLLELGNVARTRLVISRQPITLLSCPRANLAISQLYSGRQLTFTRFILMWDLARNEDHLALAIFANLAVILY